MMQIFWFVAMLLAAGSCIAAAQGVGGGAQSPASRRPPQTLNPQSYPPETVAAGQTRFVSQCGFCHGRDAAGGENRPDPYRSTLVAEESRGDKNGPVVRTGRAAQGMT